MIFNILSTDQEIIKGYSIAQEVLLSGELIIKLADVVKFTYTKDSPQNVANRFFAIRRMFLAGDLKPIPVKEYYYKSKSVIATTKKGDPSIYVNTYKKAHRSIEAYIQNGAHEFGHYPLGFSHGTNFPPGSWRGYILGDREDKNFSVPHTLGRLAVIVAKEKGLI